MTPCSVEGCERTATLKGWCRKHYLQDWRTGSPTGTKRKPLEVRFWANVDRSADCWTWTGWTDRNGYGCFAIGQGYVYAHRYVWLLTAGALPTAEQVVCHRCDNPPCVRPEHLFLGTPADNARDMRMKGRGRTKLTAEDVLAMRAAYAAGGVTYAELGRSYGVSKVAAQYAVRGLTWAHLTQESA